MARKTWFYGKNVVLSGVSSGIGLVLAKLLAGKYSCNVIGTGRNKDKLEKAKTTVDDFINFCFSKSKKSNKKKGTFTTKVLDATVMEDWQELKRELDFNNIKVDILINNAGIMMPFDKFYNQEISDAKKVFETNFFAHLYSYKTFINDLKNVKGAIINISSSSALCPVVGAGIYSASKAAIRSFTEVLAVEHKKEIYVATVCPGFTSTDLFRNEKEVGKFAKALSMSAEKMGEKIISKIRKKRKRIVLGTDAHLMSGLYRIAPKSTPNLINTALKASKDKMFDKL